MAFTTMRTTSRNHESNEGPKAIRDADDTTGSSAPTYVYGHRMIFAPFPPFLLPPPWQYDGVVENGSANISKNSAFALAVAMLVAILFV